MKFPGCWLFLSFDEWVVLVEEGLADRNIRTRSVLSRLHTRKYYEHTAETLGLWLPFVCSWCLNGFYLTLFSSVSAAELLHVSVSHMLLHQSPLFNLPGCWSLVVVQSDLKPQTSSDI